jgi:hypothetical protein
VKGKLSVLFCIAHGAARASDFVRNMVETTYGIPTDDYRRAVIVDAAARA